MAGENDFDAVFQERKAILEPYEPKLVVTTDTQDHDYLDPRHLMKNKPPLCFVAARVGKSYVSFYLMPVYVYPDLLDGASPELKKRMQGKSCFNFRSVDDKLFKELAKLTKAGFANTRRKNSSERISADGIGMILSLGAEDDCNEAPLRACRVNLGKGILRIYFAAAVTTTFSDAGS